MTFKEFLFALINFIILFGGLFFILRKMVAKMLNERKDKIAQDLDRAQHAPEAAEQAGAAMTTAKREEADREELLLTDTKRQMEEDSADIAKRGEDEISAVKENAAIT